MAKRLRKSYLNKKKKYHVRFGKISFLANSMQVFTVI